MIDTDSAKKNEIDRYIKISTTAVAVASKTETAPEPKGQLVCEKHDTLE